MPQVLRASLARQVLQARQERQDRRELLVSLAARAALVVLEALVLREWTELQVAAEAPEPPEDPEFRERPEETALQAAREQRVPQELQARLEALVLRAQAAELEPLERLVLPEPQDRAAALVRLVVWAQARLVLPE